MREKIIFVSLPVIFCYSQNEAIKLSSELPNHQMNKCWFSIILWILGNGQIGDVDDFDIFKVPSNTNTIRDKALVAFEQIKEDSYIDAAVRVLTQSIEYSFVANKLDVVNAFDILLSMEKYVTINLPDKNNIKHIGYRITALSRINGAKGQIYKDSRKKYNINQVDIRKKWSELEHLAKSEIKNAADRVYVLTILAREMHSWDKDKAEILLDSLSKNEINNIPALVDRVNRIGIIAKIWGLWGQKKRAQYLFSLLADLINEFSPYEQDAKLEQVIQAAYEISPQFAEVINEQLNSRFNDNGIKNYKKRLQELQYSGDLKKLISDSRDVQSNLQGGMIIASTERILNALLNDNGTIPSKDVLLDTLYLSTNYNPEVIIMVLKLILECENRQGTPIKSNFFTNFIESAKFTHNLANWISPITQKGLSPNIIDILPGLSSKVHIFEIGQRKKAEDWIKHWINQNTEKYIKICDPYFGPHELTFVGDIQKNIVIWVITTDEKFERKNDIENEILESWRRLGKGNNPPMRFYIVPSKLRETFHDRAIVTDKCGLNVGPSLNGLGNQRQNITELEFNEAKELEKEYIDNMLSQVRWSTDYSILPKFIAIN